MVVDGQEIFTPLCHWIKTFYTYKVIIELRIFVFPKIGAGKIFRVIFIWSTREETSIYFFSLLLGKLLTNSNVLTITNIANGRIISQTFWNGSLHGRFCSLPLSHLCLVLAKKIEGDIRDWYLLYILTQDSIYICYQIDHK